MKKTGGRISPAAAALAGLLKIQPLLKVEHGAIDHVALDVRDIEEIFQYINEAGLNSTQDTIHFLPFWENGVKFFTIEGPNKEKVEFSQYL